MRLALALALALTACRQAAETKPDLDEDGFDGTADCDDLDASVFPGAEERCDGVDQDCDGQVDEDPLAAPTWYADADRDGHGDPATAWAGCAAAEGFVATPDDCDDTAAAVHPGAAETDCSDSTDYNCDGSVGYADADADGAPACQDCDDADPARLPEAPEVCDELDNDCDGTVDEDPTGAPTYYADYDGDGFGNADVTAVACEAPEGYAASAGDCDDLAADAYPGGTEVCDRQDNDCDGHTDLDALDAIAWYRDADGDLYGTDDDALLACEAPLGYVASAGDCDDAHSAARPGGTEVCDALDNDCDGAADVDAADALTAYADADADGYGDPATAARTCDLPDGSVLIAMDCDDANPARHPAHEEICDGQDNDCDGTPDDHAVDALIYYADADADGYGDDATLARACALPLGSAPRGADCDDSNPARYPGNTERCDSLDNDCDGTPDDNPADARLAYTDADRDGYGVDGSATLTCALTATQAARTGDCDDLNALKNPGYAEICDGLDNDCDGASDEDAADATTWYRDLDRDGYGGSLVVERACSLPEGAWFDADEDCDDLDASAHPGARPLCDDVDHDCDGLIDGDDDGDGLADSSCGGSDCDDADPAKTWGIAGGCVAGVSCADALVRNSALAGQDGSYILDLDGDTGWGDPAPFWCDMTTDGGGWTSLFDWDYRLGAAPWSAYWSETLIDNLDTKTFGSSYLRLWDGDCTQDVVVLRSPVAVPNSGQIRVSHRQTLQSFEGSGVWVVGETAAGLENAWCHDQHPEDHPSSASFTASELAWKPYEVCPNFDSYANDASYSYNASYQRALSGEIAATRLVIFEACSGDDHFLYELGLSVR